MSTPLIVCTRALTGPIDVPGFDVRPGPRDKLAREDLLRHVAGAHAVVTMYTDRVDAAFLDAAGPQLRAVCNVAVGYENFDLDECSRRGVVCTNTPHAVTEGTADLAWLLIMAVARRLIEADRYARSPEYPAKGHLGMDDFLGQDLTGRTLLIVGAGRIGLGVALRALAWGMRVLYVARSKKWEFELAPVAARRVDLEDGLREADVVSIHTPLTPDTRHLINAPRLALLRPTAILVNTARGPVVDEKALVDALRRNRLYGAGLDVYEREPHIEPELLTLPNVVLTPHIGSAEAKYRAMMTRMALDNAAAVLRGRPAPNRLN